MKKRFIVAGFAALMVLAVSAQITKQDEPPKPPKPPKPPIEKVDDHQPPLPPPLPPAPPEPPMPPAPPQISKDALQIEDGYEAFLKRNSSVKSLGWTPRHEIIVRLKSGKEEKYKLDDDKSVKEAEAKYGKLPAAPPPPPPPPPPPAPPKPFKQTQLS